MSEKIAPSISHFTTNLRYANLTYNLALCLSLHVTSPEVARPLSSGHGLGHGNTSYFRRKARGFASIFLHFHKAAVYFSFDDTEYTIKAPSDCLSVSALSALGTLQPSTAETSSGADDSDREVGCAESCRKDVTSFFNSCRCLETFAAVAVNLSPGIISDREDKITVLS